MELLQLVEKFKSVLNIEKIEDVVDELKSTLLNAEKCRKLCEDWILICPDLTIDYMQMIFQYYFADRKEKMQDYTPKSLAVAVAELSKTKDEKICLDLCFILSSGFLSPSFSTPVSAKEPHLTIISLAV